MRRRLAIAALVEAVMVAAAGTYVWRNPQTAITEVTRGYNQLRHLAAPAGQIITEAGPAQVRPVATSVPVPRDDDWPSYNKTLQSRRFSPLTQIDRDNVKSLHVVCTYDTGQHTSFQTGLIMVQGALIGTTEKDIFSIDPLTCHENWRTHEDYQSANLIDVNRGAAYLDGRLFRGTQDGRVLAYDFKTGKRLWSTSVADPKKGETTPAAPIAWNNLVFIGNAGGDSKGIKGRMYALDAASGRIVWEYYLVPRAPGDPTRGPQGAGVPSNESWGTAPGIPITGGAVWTTFTLDPDTGLLYVPAGNAGPDFESALRKGSNLMTDSVVVLDARTGHYLRHVQTLAEDWHDYDVSNPPALVTTRAGHDMMLVAPKDGHLYAFDQPSGGRLYKVPVDRIENADVKFTTTTTTHFCPGAAGGAEWNGPAYDPQTNLVAVGEVDWCFSVKLQSDKEIGDTDTGATWTGAKALNPLNVLGEPDPAFTHWGGYLTAVDADSGAVAWRVRSNNPIVGGVTPTAGGLVLFGDVGGYFYAVDAASGQKLWGEKIGGAIGGGVITYAIGGVQRIAVAAGFESIIWPTEASTAKVIVLGR